VTEICRPGCIRLAIDNGVPLPNPWNIEHLRKFFHKNRVVGSVSFPVTKKRTCMRQPGEVRPQ
jgi:hypothetical protein